MRSDFENIENLSEVVLHPKADNPLHKKPVKATYSNGYFFCEGSPIEEGADYHIRNVTQFCDGFDVC